MHQLFYLYHQSKVLIFIIKFKCYWISANDIIKFIANDYDFKENTNKNNNNMTDTTPISNILGAVRK